MKATLNKFIISFTILIFVGCASHVHTVGTGPQTGSVDTARQYYILALIPLNEVDTGEMAGGAANYEIITEQGFVDILIGGLTGNVVSSRTITVTK